MKQVVDTQKAIDALLAEHPALKNNGANFRPPFGGGRLSQAAVRAQSTPAFPKAALSM